MKKRIKVKIDDYVVDAEVVKENEKTVWVRIPGGDIVKRKRLRDIVEEGDAMNARSTRDEAGAEGR